MTETHSIACLAPVYAHRRARLAARLQQGIAIIPTAPERARNRDSHYPYRYDSYFYYLTGFTEPDAVLVVTNCRWKMCWRGWWNGIPAKKPRTC